MSYTNKQRNDFLKQAAFLRGLWRKVNEYNSNYHVAKIDMSWLLNELAEAANECESEASA